ncbi:hypothetical protein MPH_02173 [Macrophomina phaseolina MS6]|uniref:Membrane-associated eicosanoid/glutathione metabolism (MAPEG) protein n=1 Tax=Macrophomina phaseolina (strain MS6) TaxID=1126212 RepID=K2SUW8_MACPH|nr:hypothetical protein MPH_02173 [Macrophomina phaseolina MS6]
MANVTFEVPREYGYVVLSACASLFNLMWHAHRTSPFRQAARVPWPHHEIGRQEISGADKAELKRALHVFNCAQRGLGNYMENLPAFLVALMIAGLRWPVESAIMGALWNFGRVLYAIGYTRNGPSNKLSELIVEIMYRVGYTMPGAGNGMGRLLGSWANIFQVVLMVMATKVGWDMVAV